MTEFSARILRLSLEPRQASERMQDYLFGLNSFRARHQCMCEFMTKD
jgi:hypothetical protein